MLGGRTQPHRSSLGRWKDLGVTLESRSKGKVGTMTPGWEGGAPWTVGRAWAEEACTGHLDRKEEGAEQGVGGLSRQGEVGAEQEGWADGARWARSRARSAGGRGWECVSISTG